MSKTHPPHAPQYRRQMVCASPWCRRVARPGSWLASSNALPRRSVIGFGKPAGVKDVARTV